MIGGLASLVHPGVSSMVPEGQTDLLLTEFAFFFFSCRLVGGLLTLSLDYCFVLEDEDGICGYALGTVDVTPFIKKCKMSWIPFMQEKYTKPNSDKELSEAEVGITCEIRTVWSLSKVGLRFFDLTWNSVFAPFWRLWACIKASDVSEEDSKIIHCQAHIAMCCTAPMKCTLVVINAVNVKHVHLEKMTFWK